MFKLYPVEPKWYLVQFDKNYTVKEFIEEVLSDEEKWGFIFIEERPKLNGSSIIIDHCYEYLYGRLYEKIPDDISSLSVKSAEAHEEKNNNMIYFLSIMKEEA